MRWKDFIRDYLSFTRRDRIAVLMILTIMGFFFFLPDLIPGSGSETVHNDTSWVVAINRLEKKDGKDSAFAEEPGNDFTYLHDPSVDYQVQPRRSELFYFDPNSTGIQEWKKLGLSERTIRTIKNYLDKGGRFYEPGDLKKIYGLKEKDYQRLLPFIKIQLVKKQWVARNEAATPVGRSPTSRYQVIDINIADTTAFISLPGIGSKLATRIVTFRNKLGGFYSIDQLGETYGLHDSVFQKVRQYFKLESISIKKININKATIDELKIHPYIRWNLANLIVSFRNEHGFFSNPEDLNNIMAITPEIYKRMAPYITVE